MNLIHLLIVVLVSFLYSINCQILTNLATRTMTECYQCNENEDSTCADPYTPQANHKAECILGGNYCRKITQTDVNGRSTVFRQCTNIGEQNVAEQCSEIKNSFNNQIICTCKSKACNSGRSLINSQFNIFHLFLLISSIILTCFNR
jgi:hypothetical protein